MNDGSRIAFYFYFYVDICLHACVSCPVISSPVYRRPFPSYQGTHDTGPNVPTPLAPHLKDGRSGPHSYSDST